MDFRTTLAGALAQSAGLEIGEIKDWIEIPPNLDMGDYAFPCFRLAKAMHKAPPVIAAELKETVKLPEPFGRVESSGGYLNFFIDKAAYAREIVGRVLREGERYGASDEGAGKNVCLDYSSINIAKPFHIGHLSSTVIGHSLARIYGFMGFHTVSINHLGDWGTQFGKLIVAYKKWGDRDVVEKGSIRALLDLYVRFHEEAEKDPSLNDEGRAWFKRIEENDSEATALFAWFKEITLRDVDSVYKLLDIEFDSYAGESFYQDKMGPVIDILREKNLLKQDDGAWLVDLSEFKMPPCLILRSDGATLYATRDLATAIYRKQTYDFYKSLYVVAYQQNLHFRQFFKVLELMGYEWVRDCVHVNFGMVSMADGTMATRKGKVVFLEDVLNAAIEKTHEIMKEKSPDLENMEDVARQVGVGAVVWGALYNSRIKDIVFSWEKALNFDGETGPYAQYTHARCCSVMRKAGAYDPGVVNYGMLTDPASVSLAKAIGAFPQSVKDAMDKNEPYLVSRSVIDVCSCFNKFYYENRIMDDSPVVRNARLAITDAARSVIKTGLYLIGLHAPERM